MAYKFQTEQTLHHPLSLNFLFLDFCDDFIEAGLFKNQLPYKNLKIEIKNIDYITPIIKFVLAITALIFFISATLTLLYHHTFMGYLQSFMIYLPVLLLGAIAHMFSKHFLHREDTISLLYEKNNKQKRVWIGWSAKPEKTKDIINLFRRQLFAKGYTPEIIIKGKPKTYKSKYKGE